MDQQLKPCADEASRAAAHPAYNGILHVYLEGDYTLARDSRAPISDQQVPQRALFWILCMFPLNSFLSERYSSVSYLNFALLACIVLHN